MTFDLVVQRSLMIEPDEFQPKNVSVSVNEMNY